MVIFYDKFLINRRLYIRMKVFSFHCMRNQQLRGAQGSSINYVTHKTSFFRSNPPSSQKNNVTQYCRYISIPRVSNLSITLVLRYLWTSPQGDIHSFICSIKAYWCPYDHATTATSQFSKLIILQTLT